MLEKTKKHKRGSITEEDISTLLQRYTATTVLALLQEVAQVPDVKIDWNALVKKTSTGISNAREYQMLWRHLAYRNSLLERLDDGAEPLDDDSDLEYELEAFPNVSSEAATEAAACVKVLIASGLPSDSSLTNGSTVEAPLTINIPNGQSSRAPSESGQLPSLMQGTNITVPVSVQKQPLPTLTSAEALDANGSASGSLPPRRKRKPWSTAEDLELIAAVQKCGEGNWANILKGDFKGDRTASQLSQRWAIIRKRQGNLNVGGGSQLSEAQLAARRAVSLALNMPMDNLKAACSIAGTNPNSTPSNSAHTTTAEASSAGAQSHQSQQDSIPMAALWSGTSGSSSKPRLTSKKPATKSALSPDPLVKAAAVAAGARIGTPSDAAFLKAVQAKNAVHIMPGGGSLIKSSVAGNSNPLPSPHLGPHPHVHYIRTGLAATPVSTYSGVPANASRPGGTQQVQGHSSKHATPMVQTSPTSNAPESNALSEATIAANLIPAFELEVKPAKDISIHSSCNALEDHVREDQDAVTGNAQKEQVEEDGAAFSGNEPKVEVQSSVSGSDLKEHVQEVQASVSANASTKQVQQDQTTLSNSEIPRSKMDFVANSKCLSGAETAGNDKAVITGNQATGDSKNMNNDNMTVPPLKDEDDKKSIETEMCKSVNGEQKDLSSMVVDGNDEKEEFPIIAAAGTDTGEEEKKRG